MIKILYWEIKKRKHSTCKINSKSKKYQYKERKKKNIKLWDVAGSGVAVGATCLVTFTRLPGWPPTPQILYQTTQILYLMKHSNIYIWYFPLFSFSFFGTNLGWSFFHIAQYLALLVVPGVVWCWWWRCLLLSIFDDLFIDILLPGSSQALHADFNGAECGRLLTASTLYNSW